MSKLFRTANFTEVVFYMGCDGKNLPRTKLFSASLPSKFTTCSSRIIYVDTRWIEDGSRWHRTLNKMQAIYVLIGYVVMDGSEFSIHDNIKEEKEGLASGTFFNESNGC